MVREALKDPETLKILERGVLGLFSIITSVTLAVAGWCLVQGWNANNQITVLSTKQGIIINDVENNKSQIDSVRAESYKIISAQQVLDQRMKNIEEDLGEIKSDIKKLLQK